MTEFLQVLSTLREQMNATLSRSDVLKPLAWLVGIISAATCTALFSKPPDWLLVVFVIALLASALLYAGSYIFCLLTDRDALRSEKYSLHKMAIEHGIYGDSTKGIIDAPETVKKLPAPVEATSNTTGAA